MTKSAKLDVAEALVQSLLKRFLQDKNGHYQLLGPITSDEYSALLLCSGQEFTPSDTNKEESQGRESPPDFKLQLQCLTNVDAATGVVAIDFGTAYSKAALWLAGSDSPTPLDLAGRVSDRPGNLLPSSLYLTNDTLYFGEEAIAVSRRENSESRRRFDSPKQELSILQGRHLDDKADAAIDPTQEFTKRDLLTLYLAFLSAATSLELDRLGKSRYLIRRFAIPVWGEMQVSQVATQVRRLLIDAQILADSLPEDGWRSGLSRGLAKHALQRLRSSVVDAQRDASPLVERYVLEASAAAAAIGDHLKNKRPIALVVDIGAGTTDLGLYRWALPQEDQARIYPFKDGGAAVKLAGDRLDDLLVAFIKERSRFDADGPDGKSRLYSLRRDIRDIKRAFFQNETLDEEYGHEGATLADFLEFPQVKNLQAKLKGEVEKLLGPVGESLAAQRGNLFVVLTGGGAQVPVFSEVFIGEFQIGSELISFKRIDVSPAWLEDYDAGTQQIFPQLAVAVGACSPSLPEEKGFITDATIAPVRVMTTVYR